MDLKPGWLKVILDKAESAVNEWPEWKRSASFNSEMAQLKKDSERVTEKAMKEMEEAENEVERQMQERINEERNNYLYDRDDE